MSGTRGRSGGKRIGAGRKPLPKETLEPIVEQPKETKPKKDKESIIKVMNTCDMKELKCPVEFDSMPFAKQSWAYVLELDKNSKYHLLNEKHYEALKSYCIAVEVRQRLIEKWEEQNKAMTIYAGSVLKINPVVKEIDAKSNQINKFAEDLGLTILSEFKMAEMRAKNKDEEDNDEGMFD
jgi:P27 family predicted phage terminase small subunit